MITPLMILWLLVFPIVFAIQCHQRVPPGIHGTPIFIEADACAISYLFSAQNFQSGVTNFEVTPGCYGNGSPKTVCFCKTDLCNSKDFIITKLTPFTNASCRDPITPHWCDSPTCLFTTDKDINACRTYDEPLNLHEMFPNIIFIDQSTITFWGNGTIKPTSSFVANCESNECVGLAEKLSTQNFSSSRPLINCYTAAKKYNLTCQGHFCYMESHFVSGCLTIVDDSLATLKPAVGYYQFLLIEFYLCTEDYCNELDVRDYRKQLKEARSTEVESTTKAACCNSHRIGFVLAIIAIRILFVERLY